MQVLDGLTSPSSVLGGVVATEDGLPLAARLPADLDGESLAAAAAAAGKLAERALSDTGRGDLEVAVLEASRSKLLVCPLTVGYLLAIADPGADLVSLGLQIADAARGLEAASASLVIAPEELEAV
jgi:predicted regulator of Ras-like GTPase activity (Roadblock/LC7/MglB family)